MDRAGVTPFTPTGKTSLLETHSTVLSLCSWSRSPPPGGTQVLPATPAEATRPQGAEGSAEGVCQQAQHFAGMHAETLW